MEEPLDKPFRRSLFIVLVAIGLLAGAAYLYARDANAELQRSEREREMLQEQLFDVLDKQNELLDDVESARAEGEQRAAALERIVVGLLALSSDPIVADAVGAQASPRAADQAVPKSRQERVAPRPSTRTAPAPAPVAPARPGNSPARPGPAAPPPQRPALDLPALPCVSSICRTP